MNVYSGSTLGQAFCGGTTLDFFYSTSGQPYALKHNGTVYYYITNLQGDVMSIVDGTGAVVVSYEYDPYGNILSTTGTLADTLGEINPLRYRGYVYDQECDLYYLQSRYYDPSIGRFLNGDAYASTGQGILGYNMFAYCMNNPIGHADATGHARQKKQEDDKFKTVGAGIQIDVSASYGAASGGGGVEIIVYWGTPECKKSGTPIVAVYTYGEGAACIDTATIQNAAQLLLKNADLLKLGGANVLDAIVASLKVEGSFSVSGFFVQTNKSFYGVNDYTKDFSTESVTIGSAKFAKAWSDSCKTYSVGYSYTFGKPAFRLDWPVYSRGYAYYWLRYSTN